MNTLVISNHGNAVKVNPETLEVTDIVYDWARIVTLSFVHATRMIQ